MMDFSKFGNRTAAVQDDGTLLKYEDLGTFSQEVGAAVLAERCLVFILCSNVIGSMASYVACLNNSMVPLLLDVSIDNELYANLRDRYRPQYIFMPAGLAKDTNQAVFEKYDYTIIKTGFDEKHRLNDSLALLLTTSGSTGSPKLVRQSYQNIEANARAIVEYLQLDDTERPITTLPMNYTYGLSIINSHLLVGATILLTEKTMMQKEFWAFFKSQRATSFGGVPYTYEMLNKLRFFRMDLPSLRTMTQAGGKLSPELHKQFAEYAIEKSKRFFVMYGQAEATARMAYLPYGKSLEKCGSMGIAIPGGELMLVDNEGNEITEPDVIGELVYKGPNVTLGYAECGEDLAKGDERKGVLVTGDMAKCDADGFYYVVGRKNRFLKIFGNRVNLDETERMIRSAFPQLDCACGGIDDSMFIFVTDEAKATEVRAYIAEKTKLNPSAFKMRAIDKIPKNEAGKTLYAKLEKHYNGL